MGSQASPLAAVQYARLDIPTKIAIANHLFDVLEYGRAGEPGGADWSSDEFRFDLSDAFAMHGVQFSDPNDLPPAYRYTEHRTARGERCMYAGRITFEPRANPDGALCPLRCPDGYVEAVPHGEEPVTDPPEKFLVSGGYAWWLEGPAKSADPADPADPDDADNYTLWMAPAASGEPDLSVASRAEDVEDWSGTRWAGDTPTWYDLRDLKAALLVMLRAGTEPQPAPAGKPGTEPEGKREPSGWVTINLDEGHGVHFRIEGGVLVETIDENDDGSPDWDAAVETDNPAEGEVIAAINTLLAFANRPASPGSGDGPAVDSGSLREGADDLFRRVRDVSEAMYNDPQFQREVTARRYRASMRGLLGGYLGDFAATMTPDVLSKVGSLIKSVAAEPGVRRETRLLAQMIVDEIRAADDDDDTAFWNERERN